MAGVIPPSPNTNEDAMPNYRHGVSNVTIALRTSKGTLGSPCSYGTPYKEVGIESITPQRGESSATNVYSDNGKPARLRGAKANDTYTAQFASLSPYFQVHALGHKQNQNTGGIVKSAADEVEVFAIGWQNEGSEKASRTWAYGCTSSEAASAAMQTHGDNVSESPDTISIDVAGDIFADGSQHYEETVYEGDPGYETFLDAVPTYATA